MIKNIVYKSKEIKLYYSSHRQSWAEFYPSERWVFERIYSKERSLGDILDIGCACAGLGQALAEKFIFSSYTGIDINKEAVEWAAENARIPFTTHFLANDFLKIRLKKQYDTVISLSCADWNIETKKIILAAWDKVKAGGYFVLSLRLTPERGINNIKQSYQYINFSGRDKKPEIANYVVFSFEDILNLTKKLTPSPELIGSYGYWGSPSPTAVTPFKKLIFVVFYIKKALAGSNKKLKCEFNLPIELFIK